jgi:hypothetical protein
MGIPILDGATATLVPTPLGGLGEIPAAERPGSQANDDREQHCAAAGDDLPDDESRKSCGAGYKSSTNRHDSRV